MKKYKNPVFWISMISTVLLAAGVDFDTLTSWSLLLNAIIGILKNPVALAMCVVTAYGIFNNNDTKKLDNPFK